MAALQTIRKRGVLLVTVIAIALFLFVAGDLFRGLESIFRNDAQQVGKVNGVSLSIQDYQKMIDEYQNFYELAQQKSSFNDEELNNIKDEAWQTYIQTQLIETECEELGIAVTDNEIAEIIKSGQSQMLQVPYFMNQQTGRFDYTTLATFLAEYKKVKDAGTQIPELYEKLYKYYMFVQRQLRSQLLSTKYQTILSQIFISNPLEAKLAFDSRATEADIILASFPASTVKDESVSVSDDEIKAKYNEDKAKYEQFVETRDLKVIDVMVTPSEADKKAAEAAVAEAAAKLADAATNAAAGNVVRQINSEMQYSDVYKTKDAFPGEIADALDSVAVGSVTKTKYTPTLDSYYAFKVLGKSTQPDSVLYRQLGVVGKDEADVAKKADSIMTALSAGAKFADIAKKYNQTSDSMWISSAQYERAAIDQDNASYINTLYGMSAGQTKKLVLEGGNTIILQVLKTAKPVTKYNVAAIVKSLKFSDETYNSAYNKFSSFVAENKSIEAIEANAPKNEYIVRSIEDVMKSNHNIAGIRGTRDAIKWAFDTAEPGDISPLYECGSNDHLLLVVLTGVNEKGYRPLNKMKDVIKEELLNEKKIAELCKKVEGVKSIADAQKQNAVIDTINHVSFAAPTFVAATTSSEPLVGATAVKTSEKAVSAPIKGKAGVYVLQVLKKNKTEEAFDEKSEEASIGMNTFRSAANMVVNALYRRADVEDNRYKFF